MRYPDAFYVYQLIDPRNDLPFYVGKGQWDRAWHHQRAVERGVSFCNARKTARISEILAAGYNVEVLIVAEYDLESEALEHEWRMVDADPTLTNIMPGGIGRLVDPAFVERRRLARKRKLNMIRRREREAALRRAVDRKRGHFHHFTMMDKQREEIDVWLDGLSNKRALLGSSRVSTKRSKAALAEFRANKPSLSP